MLLTVQTQLLPTFSVHVNPVCDDEYTVQQPYMLVLHDGALSTLELTFPSAQHLTAFLRAVRESLADARAEVQARKTRLARPAQPALF